jgi:hypothetical protein
MAKKKTTTVTEEVEETPIDYVKDLKDKTMEQVAAAPKEEPEITEEVKEVPVEEKKTVEFDPEQLKKEAVDEARAVITQELKGDTKEETKENVDAYQEYQKDFFEKNNRQPTWFEVSHFMEDRAVERLRAEQAAESKAREEAATKQQEDLKQQTDATNKYVDDTLNELYSANKLPRIQDKDNPDDYGKRVQGQLLRTVVEVNQKRIESQLPPKTLKEIFYEDFKMPERQVAGANAPVNMGRGGYNPDNDSEEIDYRDIAGPQNSFKRIISKAFNR